MNVSLKEKISKLPVPNIFTSAKFEDIKKENIKILTEANPDWIPVESDSNMMHIELLSYKEAMLKTMFNSAIKAMLPHYAKDEDLDNFIFGMYAGETRLEGEEPTAAYEFSIEESLSKDIIVPKGLVLSNNDDTYTSVLLESITIAAGTLKANGKVQLNKKVKESTVKTENVISPYPYVLTPKSLEDFTGGSEVESDEEFFERAILSLNQYSTAGSEKAYEYFTYKADERVKDVDVQSPSEGVVDIYIDVDSNNDAKSKVEAIFNDEKVQALNDHVNVHHASIKEVTVTGTIHIFDLLDESNVRKMIEDNFSRSFKIGEDLPYSALIKNLHVAGVFKVELTSNSDLNVANNEKLNLTFNLNFVKANYE